MVFCLCCASPLSASILTTVETKPLKRSGSDESSTECSHFVWLNLLWQASMLCFGKTCCCGNPETSQFREKNAPHMRCSKDLTWDLRKGLRQVFASSPFCSQSTQDACIVFAYLWEMGVTVIKLTGSQFCRVWIMKSYKMWKSKDILFKKKKKISFNLVAVGEVWLRIWLKKDDGHIFDDSCQKMVQQLQWLLEDGKYVHNIL